MDEATRKALQSETVYYITAALVTILAIIISFKWVWRKAVRREGAEDRNCKEPLSSSDQTSSCTCTTASSEDKPTQTVDDGNRQDRDNIPEEEEDELEDLGDLGDILINHEEIKPLESNPSEDASQKVTEGGEGEGVSEEDLINDTDYLVGPQKTKKLVEEVSKMMSEEQKEEERRIQASQLEAIFKLMQNQQETFGMNTIKDVHDQFKLYA